MPLSRRAPVLGSETTCTAASVFGVGASAVSLNGKSVGVNVYVESVFITIGLLLALERSALVGASLTGVTLNVKVLGVGRD